ncbi:MAG: MerR family transcriptional regulator [Xanthomonadales bacterium]|nr:MerR family transcriptional regulator [Xanthomonadales bacterium]
MCVYSVKSVVSLTGVPASTLRSWERRHGVVSPGREDGRRRYSEADVARLTQLRELIKAGHRIGDLASLDQARLDELSRRAEGGDRPTDALMAALSNYDVDALDFELARLMVATSAEDLVTTVLPSMLQDVGERWRRGELTIAQERLLSSAIRGHLFSLVNSLGRGQGAEILTTTPAGERHELGLLLFSLIAARHGVPVRYLGPDLPLEEIARLGRALRPSVVAISMLVTGDPEAVVVALRENLPEEVELWVGGRAAAQVAVSMSGVRLATDVRRTMLLIRDFARRKG